jgi:hypothetical protein
MAAGPLTGCFGLCLCPAAAPRFEFKSHDEFKRAKDEEDAGSNSKH